MHVGILKFNVRTTVHIIVYNCMYAQPQQTVHACTHLYLRLGRGLAETLWGMGGTLVTDECHLFDW